ncbi:hypothetical protein F0562_014158 [Nyssa sinensis]|uniref:Uncharacterized protein n=1 Tax=Nyssa sinensis TaxID=561372 RepID=A0A5J4ZR67_9ASTE|nr:hypothetical protein F0562_014158 [Nyssa sinensis]
MKIIPVKAEGPDIATGIDRFKAKELHLDVEAKGWPRNMPNLEMDLPVFSLVDMFNYLELLVIQNFQGHEAEVCLSSLLLRSR